MEMTVRLEPELRLARCPHCDLEEPRLDRVSLSSPARCGSTPARVWGVFVCAGCGGMVLASAASSDEPVDRLYPSPVKSTGLGGTTYSTVEPPARQPDDGAYSLPAWPSPLGNGETIMLVDDDVVVRAVVTAMLGKLNYRVLSLDSAEEALDVLRTQQPVHLVITDVAMPGMDGAELVDALRREAPGLKVMVLSGHPAGGRWTTEGAGHVSCWVNKPPSLHRLAQTLHDLLAE